jgi:hypothetical protein
MFTLFRQRERINHLAFSPSGLTLAAAVTPSGSRRDRIRVWDLIEREPEAFLDPDGDVAQLLFVRDDATLVIQALPAWELWLLDALTGQRRPLFDSDDDIDLDFSVVAEDGESVVAAFVPRAPAETSVDVRQVEVSTGQEGRRAQFAIKARISHLALRPGNPILLAVQEQPLRRVLLSPGRLPEEIDVPGAASTASLQFAPDGRTLALRTARSVRLWDVTARRLTAKVVERTALLAMAFSPDGRTLATGTTDGVVRLYDVGTGHPRQAFDWQIDPVHALAFAPDGLRAAAGGKKGTIVVWDVDG